MKVTLFNLIFWPNAVFILKVYNLRKPLDIFPAKNISFPLVSFLHSFAGSAQGLFSTLTAFGTVAPVLVGSLSARPGGAVGDALLSGHQYSGRPPDRVLREEIK